MIARMRLMPLTKTVRWLLLVVGVVVVFGLGLDVGDGRISLHSLSGQNKNLPANLNYSSVNEVYQHLKTEYDGKLTTNQLLDGLKAGLANATGDPYTEYFNPTQAKAFTNELDGSFAGIGAQLGADSSGNIEVIAPLSGTPADKAGLIPKDIITAINGKSTSGMSIDTAVTAIHGPSGSQVTLDIVRGSGQQLTFKITRANITVPSANYKILDGNIGYLTINQFGSDTVAIATKAAQSFQQAHVKGIILDLRDNPGGFVSSAVGVSSLWLPVGQTILQEKTGNTVVETDSSTGNNLLRGVSTVVLINAGSASASEIVTGALHDNKAAYVIGEKSYGKGVVQQVDDLPGGAELKVTIASWYRPNGQNINHKGIAPDQTVQLTDAQAKAGQDPQKDTAIQYLSK